MNIRWPTYSSSNKTHTSRDLTRVKPFARMRMLLDCAILEDGNVPLVEIFPTVGCQPRHEEFMGPCGIQQRPLRRVQSCFARTSSSAMPRISASTTRPSKSIGCVRFECACSLTVVCLIPRGICNMATCRFRFYQRLFPHRPHFPTKTCPLSFYAVSTRCPSACCSTCSSCLVISRLPMEIQNF